MDTNLETGGELVMHRCYMIIFIVYYVDPNQQCLGRLAFPFAVVKKKKPPELYGSRLELQMPVRLYRHEKRLGRCNLTQRAGCNTPDWRGRVASGCCFLHGVPSPAVQSRSDRLRG